MSTTDPQKEMDRQTVQALLQRRAAQMVRLLEHWREGISVMPCSCSKLQEQRLDHGSTCGLRVTRTWPFRDFTCPVLGPTLHPEAVASLPQGLSDLTLPGPSD